VGYAHALGAGAVTSPPPTEPRTARPDRRSITPERPAASASPASNTLPPTLPGLLEVAVARGGSAPFLGVRTSTTREASLTLPAFGDAVENAAARLAAALEPRTRVMVQGAPGPGFAAALFAAARADVILVPLDVRMTSDTIDLIAVLTEPSAILLGFGSTVEPATIPRLAGLPILDLDDLVDPAPPEAVAALAAREPADPAEPLEILWRRGRRADEGGRPGHVAAAAWSGGPRPPHAGARRTRKHAARGTTCARRL
jgi:AMP-binding enzyme